MKYDFKLTDTGEIKLGCGKDIMMFMVRKA